MIVLVPSLAATESIITVSYETWFPNDWLFGVDFVEENSIRQGILNLRAPWQNATDMIGFISLILLVVVKLKPVENTMFLNVAMHVRRFYNQSFYFLADFHKVHDGQNMIFTHRRRTLFCLFTSIWWWRHTQLYGAVDDLIIAFATLVMTSQLILQHIMWLSICNGSIF